LIEELEAHLHPQAQMRVIEYLQNKSEPNIAAAKQQPEGGGPKNDAGSVPTNVEANGHTGFQTILTTHSPNLASKVKLKNVIICHGKDAFPMGPKYTRLEQNDYAFLERFLDVTKANLF
jgi:putative ATP-dependent endonuclease of OLD family